LENADLNYTRFRGGGKGKIKTNYAT